MQMCFERAFFRFTQKIKIMFSTISNISFFRVAFFFLMVSVLSMSCQPDDTEDGTITLNHDGANVIAPELPGQREFESATRFPATQMANYIGDELIEIEFYIYDTPASCELFVYTSTGGNVPTTEVYSSGNIVNSLNTRTFNTLVLPEPLVLDAEDLWIGVRYTQNGSQRTVGCDDGPAAVNGDWLYDSTDGNWLPLVQRTSGALNINWNIRAVVELKE